MVEKDLDRGIWELMGGDRSNGSMMGGIPGGGRGDHLSDQEVGII